MSVAAPQHAGALLREWRHRRNVSQLELATGSAVSTRHLSFIETGRARPSREMVLHLAERLDIPFRERNRLLLAAGFAPVFTERSLDDEEMAPVREVLDRFLAANELNPLVVVDRNWDIALMNDAVAVLTEGVAPDLLEAPANALRIALHPEGMAPRILNLAELSSHILRRVRRELTATKDERLERLYRELRGYPGVTEAPLDAATADDVMLTVRLRRDGGELAFFNTITVFGTARDITLAELSIEAFYPADESTAAYLRAHRDSRAS